MEVNCAASVEAVNNVRRQMSTEGGAYLAYIQGSVCGPLLENLMLEISRISLSRAPARSTIRDASIAVTILAWIDTETRIMTADSVTDLPTQFVRPILDQIRFSEFAFQRNVIKSKVAIRKIVDIIADIFTEIVTLW